MAGGRIAVRIGGGDVEGQVEIVAAADRGGMVERLLEGEVVAAGDVGQRSEEHHAASVVEVGTVAPV